jgi:hypothetical protein
VIDILALYLWTFPFLALMTALLAFCGAHLATRGRTVQTLSIAQGAELGSLAFMIFSISMDPESIEPNSWRGIPGAVGFAFLAGLLAEKLSIVKVGSRSTLLFTLWIVLSASSLMLVALHPALESHFSRVTIGDVATLSRSDSQILSLALFVFGIYLFLRRSHYLHQSFADAILGSRFRSSIPNNSLFLVILPALSTWSLGFMYTCAALFIPTTILSLSSRVGARLHIFRCCFVGLVAAPLSLLVALVLLPGQPTAPILVLGLLLAAGLVLFSDSLLLRISSRKIKG